MVGKDWGCSFLYVPFWTVWVLFIMGMCNFFCFTCINYIFLGFFQISLALCFVLMFGNSMLLTSYYASSLVIIWVSTWLCLKWMVYQFCHHWPGVWEGFSVKAARCPTACLCPRTGVAVLASGAAKERDGGSPRKARLLASLSELSFLLPHLFCLLSSGPRLLVEKFLCLLLFPFVLSSSVFVRFLLPLWPPSLPVASPSSLSSSCPWVGGLRLLVLGSSLVFICVKCSGSLNQVVIQLYFAESLPAEAVRSLWHRIRTNRETPPNPLLLRWDDFLNYTFLNLRASQRSYAF